MVPSCGSNSVKPIPAFLSTPQAFGWPPCIYESRARVESQNLGESCPEPEVLGDFRPFGGPGRGPEKKSREAKSHGSAASFGGYPFFWGSFTGKPGKPPCGGGGGGVTPKK